MLGITIYRDFPFRMTTTGSISHSLLIAVSSQGLTSMISKLSYEEISCVMSFEADIGYVIVLLTVTL